MKEKATQLFKNFDEINLIFIAVVVVGAWLLILASERVLPWIADHAPTRLRLHVLRLVPVLRLFVLAVAFVQVTTQIITPTPENLIATVGAAGLALGFAFKDYASSLIAGVVTIYERPYRQGDWLQVGDAYGEVKSIGLRSFRLLTPDDTTVIVPHSVLWTESLYNNNDGHTTQQCVADFYLHPRHDARRVQALLRNVAWTSAYLDLDRPVAVIVAEKPWGTHYRVKAYPIDARRQFVFTTDLTVRGKQALSDLGVEPAAMPAAVASGA